MAEAVKLSTNRLPFYESQKRMRQIEIASFVVGMMALISVAVLLGMRPSSLTKASLIATTAAIGATGLVFALGSIYLYRNWTIFGKDPEFYKPFATFKDFFNKYSLSLFQSGQINANDPVVQTQFASSLFDRIESKGFKEVFAEYCRTDDARNIIIDILKANPERLKNCFINFFKKNDLYVAREWQLHIPEDLCKEGEPLANVVRYLKTPEGQGSAWVEFREKGFRTI